MANGVQYSCADYHTVTSEIHACRFASHLACLIHYYRHNMLCAQALDLNRFLRPFRSFGPNSLFAILRKRVRSDLGRLKNRLLTCSGVNMKRTLHQAVFFLLQLLSASHSAAAPLHVTTLMLEEDQEGRLGGKIISADHLSQPLWGRFSLLPTEKCYWLNYEVSPFSKWSQWGSSGSLTSTLIYLVDKNEEHIVVRVEPFWTKQGLRILLIVQVLGVTFIQFLLDN